MPGGKRSCAYYLCRNVSSKGNSYRMFTFPSIASSGSEAEERCKEWMERTCNPKIMLMAPSEVSRAHKLVCEDHFEPCQFHNENQRKLNRDQVPKWNVIHETADDLCHTAGPLVKGGKVGKGGKIDSSTKSRQGLKVVQAASEAHCIKGGGIMRASEPSRISDQQSAAQSGLTMENLTSRKTPLTELQYYTLSLRLLSRMKKIKGDLRELRISLYNDRLWRQLEDELGSDSCDLSRRKRLNFRKRNGRIFSEDAQSLSLAIFGRVPKVYRFLSLHMRLPSEETLRSWLRKIPLEVGINAELQGHSKKGISSWPLLDKICAVVFGEFPLKPFLSYNKSVGCVDGFTDMGNGKRERTVADRALVFMVQGLRRKWHQPFAYYFVNGTSTPDKVAQIIVEVVSALLSVGFGVVTSVSDLGSRNRAAIKILRNSGDTGNIWHCDGVPIQHMYDVGHVTYQFRDDHLSSDINTQEGVAKWEHIEECVRIDRKLGHMMYKITDDHINPQGTRKKDVAAAIQVYSRIMGAMMGTIRKASCGKSLPGSEATELVVSTVNKAVDLTNGPSGPDDENDFRRNVTAKSAHHGEWPKLLEVMSEWTFTGKRGQSAAKSDLPSLRAWIANITGVQRLWVELHGAGLKVLNLRQLSLGGLEDFFRCCRQTCNSKTNPTVVQFESAFKTSILNDLPGRSRDRDCEDDADTDAKLLSKLRTFLKPDRVIPEREATDISDCVPLGLVEEASQSPSRRPTRRDRKAAMFVVAAVLRTVIQPITSFACEVCAGDLLAGEASSGNQRMAMKFNRENGSVFYPSVSAINFFFLARVNFMKVWVLHNFSRDVKRRYMQSIETADTFDWLTCEDHRHQVRQSLIHLTVDFHLRKMAKRTNQKYGMSAKHPGAAKTPTNTALCVDVDSLQRKIDIVTIGARPLRYRP